MLPFSPLRYRPHEHLHVAQVSVGMDFEHDDGLAEFAWSDMLSGRGRRKNKLLQRLGWFICRLGFAIMLGRTENG